MQFVQGCILQLQQGNYTFRTPNIYNVLVNTNDSTKIYLTNIHNVVTKADNLSAYT